MSDAARDRDLKGDLASLRIEGRSNTPAPVRRSRRWRLVAALLVLAALAVVTARALRPTDVTTAVVERRDTSDAGPVPVLSGSGYVVTADKYIAIGVRIPGRIEKFFVDEADRVKAGDPLVQLDDRDYKAALESAQARLGVARANAQLHKIEL